MKKNLLKLAILFVSLQSFAQNVELSNALINEFQAKHNTIALKSASTSASQDLLWMTPFLHKVFSNWDNLTQEAKDIFDVYMSAPVLGGDATFYDSGFFTFHYTTNSSDAGENVDTTDLSGNGVPDYVDSMAAAFAEVEVKYHNILGLVKPIYNEWGYYNIYLSGTAAGENTYGYVQPETVVGDNPNSTMITEIDAMSSIMVMRNNYDDFGDAVKAMKVTAAHEYMHALQFSHDMDMESWFMEACATWGEEYVFPGYDDNFQYLNYVLKTPDISLNVDDHEGEDYEGHWYGTFLFTQYMVEQTNPEIIGQIYEELVGDLQDESVTSKAIYSVLKANIANTSWTHNFVDFADLFTSYALAGTIMSEANMFAPYNYARANDYYAYVGSDFYEESQFVFNMANIAFDSETDGNDRLMRLSYDPFSLTSYDNFKLSLTTTGNLDLALVKIASVDADIVLADESNVISVTDNDYWDYYYIAVIRNDSNVTIVDTVNYSLAIEEIVSTGLEETLSEVSISPNPANGFFSIMGCEHIQSVNIMDMYGRVVLSQNLLSTESVDVSALASGAYLLNIKSEDKPDVIKTIIINN